MSLIKPEYSECGRVVFNTGHHHHSPPHSLYSSPVCFLLYSTLPLQLMVISMVLTDQTNFSHVLIKIIGLDPALTYSIKQILPEENKFICMFGLRAWILLICSYETPDKHLALNWLTIKIRN